jgi:transposase
MDTKTVEYNTKRLDHLGIVAGICHEIGLVGTINEMVPTRSDRRVSCGTATLAMILNGLGFTGRALYLMPEYMGNKPVKLLTGEDLEASDFNDDTLGRALDDLYQTGITELFAQIAQDAVATYNLDVAFAHTDTSSFSLTGQYESEIAPAVAAGRDTVKITHGYSKDHRPDLKQVVVTLVTSQKGRIPLWLEALDGNSSDKHSFRKTVNAYCRHLADEGKEPWFVMDSAAYTAANIGNWGTQKKWLTRVPETITEARTALQSVATDEMTQLDNGYAIAATTSTYGGIEQRWLVIYSPQAEQRELKQLNKRVARATTKAEKVLKTLHTQEFACEKDARQAVDKIARKLKWHTVTATYQPIKKYPKPGRPPKGARRQVVGWRVKATCQIGTNRLEKAQQGLGRFLLATNELDQDRLPDETMLDSYKEQGITVERGFRFLKDPLFFADSLFLKNPARIMAMIMIMGLCLLIYALAEWWIRQQLQEREQTIPDQKGQPTQTPTMRRIAQMFEGIDLLVVRQREHIVEQRVLQLTPVRLQIIRLFGPAVQNCYLAGF